MRRPLPLAVLLTVVLAAPAAAQTAPAAPAAPDTTAPVISHVVLVAATVRASDGAAVRFTLSEEANVAGVLAEHRAGRIVGRRCVPGAKPRAAGKHRRLRKACTKLVRVGGFYVAAAPAGDNVVKLGLKALKPGRYRVTLSPRDRTGNLGRAAAVELRIVA